MAAEEGRGSSRPAPLRALREARQLLLEEPASWTGAAAYRTRHEWVRELRVGFKAKTDFEDIIRAHIEDEFGGNVS